MKVLLFVFLSSLLGANCIVVNITDGPIDGTMARSRSGRLFHKFMSVPYAKPPVNELRFKPPESPTPWTEVKDATNPPPMCVQFTVGASGSISGQEDCLYLNVYVPDELFDSTQRNPVVVGIHGGGFLTGSSNDYQPDYFMERDAIVVTINYRLGTFGFFGLNNNNISGNFGLKDQSLALKWVNANIVHFGGDPQNVTILGESAGAVSVHYHMFSPLSKGLFQKAIMESGSAYAQWASLPDTVQKVVRNLFLIYTGCILSNDTLKCLQNKSAEDFVTKYGLGSGCIFLPMVEDKVENEPFLSQTPNLTNYVTQVPAITGINSGEGALIMMLVLRNGPEDLCTMILGNSTTCIKQINAQKKISLPILNFYIVSAQGQTSDLSNVTEAVKQFYFGTEDISMETASQAVNMITDSAFLYPLMKNVESYLTQPSLQQYLYLYDHRGSYSAQDSMNLTIELGVCHADEYPLLFRIEQLEAKRTLQDKIVAETLQKYWINFAISGDPNRHSVEKIWQPVNNTSGDIGYLHITSDNVKMEKNMFADRYNLWCSLPTGWIPCSKN